jgi:hypothetical protein
VNKILKGMCVRERKGILLLDFGGFFLFWGREGGRGGGGCGLCVVSLFIGFCKFFYKCTKECQLSDKKLNILQAQGKKTLSFIPSFQKKKQQREGFFFIKKTLKKKA